MVLTFEKILLAGSLLLFFSIIISKTTGKMGVPGLVVFLLIGMLAGSEGIGRIEFENYSIAQAVGSVGLVFILFSGGLDTKWHSVKPVMWAGLTLSSAGVFLTAIF